MNIIEAENLAVGYGNLRILENMVFSVPKGRITVVAGVSGSGKSTLLKTLAGLMRPLEGNVSFDGTQVDYYSEASLGHLFKKIGVLYQGGALLNNLSLFENVALPIRMQYPRMPEGIICRMLCSSPMTTVWPALLPPWNRTTQSASSARKSTIFPFPSSPH